MSDLQKEEWELGKKEGQWWYILRHGATAYSKVRVKAILPNSVVFQKDDWDYHYEVIPTKMFEWIDHVPIYMHKD